MAKDKYRDLADEARERAEDAYEAAHAAIEDGIDEAHRYLKRQWRERPITVAAAALGIGVLLGALLTSRR
jgi:ElaB/YqjD/DUF883 family membrane-anchored ribosome-binding protein